MLDNERRFVCLCAVDAALAAAAAPLSARATAAEVGMDRGAEA
jgi:hypothetical protein